MIQKNKMTACNNQQSFSSESDSIKINVFTSSSCAFCNDALAAAKKVAKKFHKFDFPIEVIETSVEEQPELIEALNVIALPLILIGSSQIIGLPSAEEIELILHRNVLAG
ncbi:MAG: thioredoxin family protein [Candidatus Sifarchaeia archaeon]